LITIETAGCADPVGRIGKPHLDSHNIESEKQVKHFADGSFQPTRQRPRRSKASLGQSPVPPVTPKNAVRKLPRKELKITVISDAICDTNSGEVRNPLMSSMQISPKKT